MTRSGDGGGSFEERLRTARQKRGLDAAPSEKTGGAGPGPSALGVALRVGIELVSAMVVAVMIGWGLDRWLGTRPILMATFVLIGGAAGVANVWRQMAPGRSGPDED